MNVKEIDNERLKQVQEFLGGTLNLKSKSVERREELMKSIRDIHGEEGVSSLIDMFEEVDNVKTK